MLREAASTTKLALRRFAPHRDAQSGRIPRSWIDDFASPAIAVVVVLIVASVGVPSFFDSANLRGLAPQVAALALLAIGETLVLLVRGLDLSVVAVITMTAVVLTDDTFGSVPIRVLIVIAIALATGLANGLLVTKRNVPPFIATFGTLTFLTGAQVAYTQGQTSGLAPQWMVTLGSGTIASVSWAIVILVGIGLVGGIVINHTSCGRWIYAIGSNPDSARYAGINVDATTIGCYVACSLLAAVAGVLMAGFAGYIDFTLGVNANLDAIAAAVIGGVAFTGGRGKLLGAIAGAFVIISIQNLLTLSGLAIQWRYVFEGALLIAAISVQGVRERASGRL